MKRLYEDIVREHLQNNEQMLFLAGPRQVGKTTISLIAENLTDHFLYLNFDNEKHRQIIMQGEDAILQNLQFNSVMTNKPILVLDELHKHKHWKRFLKGFYDIYKNKIKIIVTGSAKLNIYQAGGDSLLGRYLLYRVHPFSVAELLGRSLPDKEISEPKKIDPDLFQQLLTFGGFPQPLLKADARFATQWRRLRQQQLLREDVRDLGQIQNIAHLELLANLIKNQAGQMVSYANLANAVRVSADTIRRWVQTLESLYYCFTIKPWSKNVKRSLIKEPKVFLWDWSGVEDSGARAENFVAAHLLKAVHFWTDYGLGDYGLYFLRDKDKREVDFLVTKNHKPWFLVEVKSSSNHSINKSLHYFQQQLKAQHAFQLVFDGTYVAKNCFDYKEPVIASAQTFLSQLI